MKKLLSFFLISMVLPVPSLAKEKILPDYPSQAKVPFHYVVIGRSDSPAIIFGKNLMTVARFNRIHPSKIRIGVKIKVPNDLEAARNYSPFPDFLAQKTAEKRYVVIDIAEQFLGAYEYGTLQFSAPISSANFDCVDEKFRRKACYTPPGKFKVLAFHRDHLSSIYKDATNTSAAPMPYAVLFFIENFLGKQLSYWLHQGELPGRPDSHGCVRLMPEDAKKLFIWLGGSVKNGDIAWVKNGASVEVINNDFAYVRQGDILLEEITDKTASAVFLEKLGQNSYETKSGVIFETNGKRYVLVPIGITAKPGKYALKLYAQRPVATLSGPMGETSYEKTVVVDRGTFPKSISSGWNTRPFSKKELERIAKEKTEIAKAYQLGQDQPMWLSGFGEAVEVNERIGTVTHHFGEIRINPKNKRRRYHFGADIKAPEGYPIHAIADGKVVLTGKNYFLEGNLTIIDHGAGVFSLYLHQSKFLVSTGRIVKKGDIIGEAGQTGNANGPHLHLSVKIAGTPSNPVKLIELMKKIASK